MWPILALCSFGQLQESQGSLAEGNPQVFKRYLQLKRKIKRETLEKINWIQAQQWLTKLYLSQFWGS